MRKRIDRVILAVLLLASPLAGGVSHLELDQMIMPVTEEILVRAIEQAGERGDELLVVSLSTPGGLETATRRIVNRMLTSPVPIVVWVSPTGERAASAGLFILIAADVAAMAPGTNTGAAHPVLMNTEPDEVMQEKMRNDSAAFIRTIAAKRGRNPEAAEQGVRESVAWTETEALELGLIDLIAADMDALLAGIDGREIRRFNGETVVLQVAGDEVHPVELTLRQRVLSFIMNPNVAFILLSLGMLALWAEFQNPGAIVPGAIGALSIILAIIALNMLPTRFAAVALLLAAFIFFALEAKFTSHGVFGIAGVISMFIGAMLLVDGPIPEMRVSWPTALAVAVSFGLIAIFLMTLAMRTMRHKVSTGVEGMAGEVGVAETLVDPTGKVFVHGELWTARSAVPIPPGTPIRVRAVRDLVLEVEPAQQARSAAEIETKEPVS